MLCLLGMYKKKSFFSGRTIANVVAGMFIYHMTSNLVSGLLGGGFSKRPVNVYNYYNQPEVKEEMKLPSNILTLCEGNSTKLCTSGKIFLFTFVFLYIYFFSNANVFFLVQDVS